MQIEERNNYCSGVPADKQKKDKMNDPLLKAIEANDCTALMTLSKGCYLPSKEAIEVKEKNDDHQYFSLFGYVCKVNSVECVMYLLKAGGGIEESFNGGETSLFQAIKSGNENITKFLINEGANVETVNALGSRPIHYAMIKSTNLTKMLIESGADVEARFGKGFTPLHYAAMKNNLELTKLLINSGAKVEAKDDEGKTAIQKAPYFGKVKEFLIKALNQQIKATKMELK